MHQQQVLVIPLDHRVSAFLYQVLNGLYEKGYPIERVLVVHFEQTDDGAYEQDITSFATIIARYNTQDTRPFISWSAVPLSGTNGLPIFALANDVEVNAALLFFRDLVAKSKREGQHIHWVLSSGDRMMAYLSVLVGMIQFDVDDHFWDISHSLEEEPTPGEAHTSLIEMPLLRLGKLMNVSSASLVRDAEQETLHNEDEARCERVYQQCTPRQRQVLEAFARGATPPQVASQLSIGIHGVISHEQAIFALCRQAWNISGETMMSYSFLRLKFASYFQ